FFLLFACIRVSDSLADGLSYFYAEVKRLKAILDSVKNHPHEVHFVLIDEIFRGTNNRERRIGSQSYIRALAELPVIGAIATHDYDDGSDQAGGEDSRRSQLSFSGRDSRWENGVRLQDPPRAMSDNQCAEDHGDGRAAGVSRQGSLISRIERGLGGSGGSTR